MHKYGDGIFCRNCGKSEEDVKKEKECLTMNTESK